ncbi:hypothetical protein J6590_100397, partial [Homalodisca vitripennis]
LRLYIWGKGTRWMSKTGFPPMTFAGIRYDWDFLFCHKRITIKGNLLDPDYL